MGFGVGYGVGVCVMAGVEVEVGAGVGAGVGESFERENYKWCTIQTYYSMFHSAKSSHTVVKEKILC